MNWHRLRNMGAEPGRLTWPGCSVPTQCGGSKETYALRKPDAGGKREVRESLPQPVKASMQRPAAVTCPVTRPLTLW